VRHRPDAAHRFTLQIGDPSTIATGTGIDTVADFRRADLALGGEAAPLVPAFHEWLFATPSGARAILNLGGIANLTLLPGDGGATRGFDVGPANTLLDAWARRHLGRPYDEGGAWAATGRADDALLERLLGDPWFAAEPPKSTGFEYFNAAWLERHEVAGLAAADVQATLVELTAASVGDAIGRWAPGTAEVFVCGGGSHNATLLEAIERQLPGCAVKTTMSAGLDPDWVEATAFAWLAARTLSRRTGSLATVTGAARDAVLGGVYAGAPRPRPEPRTG
jgi:anhydro-N-acetylmuramic acid kinase